LQRGLGLALASAAALLAEAKGKLALAKRGEPGAGQNKRDALMSAPAEGSETRSGRFCAKPKFS